MALNNSTTNSSYDINSTSSIDESDNATVTVTRGAGASDTITNAYTVSSVTKVYSGQKVYTAGTDFTITENGQSIAWGIDADGNTLTGASVPDKYATYSVDFVYAKTVKLGTFTVTLTGDKTSRASIGLNLGTLSDVSANRTTLLSDINSYLGTVLDKVDEIVSGNDD